MYGLAHFKESVGRGSQALLGDCVEVLAARAKGSDLALFLKVIGEVCVCVCVCVCGCVCVEGRGRGEGEGERRGGRKKERRGGRREKGGEAGSEGKEAIKDRSLLEGTSEGGGMGREQGRRDRERNEGRKQRKDETEGGKERKREELYFSYFILSCVYIGRLRASRCTMLVFPRK